MGKALGGLGRLGQEILPREQLDKRQYDLQLDNGSGNKLRKVPPLVSWVVKEVVGKIARLMLVSWVNQMGITTR